MGRVLHEGGVRSHRVIEAVRWPVISKLYPSSLAFAGSPNHTRHDQSQGGDGRNLPLVTTVVRLLSDPTGQGWVRRRFREVILTRLPASPKTYSAPRARRTAFHSAAGPRPSYGPKYYAAVVTDLAGNTTTHRGGLSQLITMVTR